MRNRVSPSGTYSVICDRCGFKFKNHQLRKEWTGAMVCHGPGTNDCFEPRHPQEFVRAKRDNPVLPFIRPDIDGIDVGPALNCTGLVHQFITMRDMNALLVEDMTVYKVTVTGGGTLIVPAGTTLTILCELIIE